MSEPDDKDGRQRPIPPSGVAPPDLAVFARLVGQGAKLLEEQLPQLRAEVGRRLAEGEFAELRRMLQLPAAAQVPSPSNGRKARSGRAGGRPPKFDFTAFDQEATRAACFKDQSRGDTMLLQHMRLWSDTHWETPPADSTVRRRIKHLGLL